MGLSLFVGSQFVRQEERASWEGEEKRQQPCLDPHRVIVLPSCKSQGSPPYSVIPL